MEEVGVLDYCSGNSQGVLIDILSMNPVRELLKCETPKRLSVGPFLDATQSIEPAELTEQHVLSKQTCSNDYELGSVHSYTANLIQRAPLPKHSDI